MRTWVYSCSAFILASLVLVPGCTEGNPPPSFLEYFGYRDGRIPKDEGWDVGSVQALLDADRDGDLDAFVIHADFEVSPPKRYPELWLNDGDATFRDDPARMPPGEVDHVTRSASGDVDGDGDPDLACVTSTGINFLLMNDGKGFFTSIPALLVPGETCLSVILVDVDGDKDLDALLAIDGPNRVFLNDGKGDFTLAFTFPGGGEETVRIFAGELNWDVKPDAVVIDRNGSCGIWKGNGDGSLTQYGSFPIPPETRTAGLADIDGDGDLDLLVGGSERFGLYINTGFGEFACVEGRVPEWNYDTVVDIAFVDIDLDGDVDAYVSTWGSTSGTGWTPFTDNRNRVLLNDGFGCFYEDARWVCPGGSSYTIESGDLDGDGDPDFLITDYFWPYLVVNKFR